MKDFVIGVNVSEVITPRSQARHPSADAARGLSFSLAGERRNPAPFPSRLASTRPAGSRESIRSSAPSLVEDAVPLQFSVSTFGRTELAISAAPYDSMLVAELSERLALRLSGAPYWSGSAVSLGDDGRSDVIEDAARVVIVLFQRLWQHDDVTRADAAALSIRMQTQPQSVRVVLLDAEPAPEWLAAAPQCSLSAVGVDGVIDFILGAIAECGGVFRSAPPPPVIEEGLGEKRWNESPSFLSQRRALSTLRHELDALGARIAPHLRKAQEQLPDQVVQLQTLPFRFLVQLGTVGLSFSWVGTGVGDVAGGRLLVIEWSGLLPRARGTAVLKSASPTRERVYRADAAGPDSWKWRSDGPNGRAYSSANLADEWLAGAALAAGA
jgi:hypothetical protein